MRIRVLLFAQLKEACGSAEIRMDLPESSTIRDAVNKVMSQEKLERFKELPLRFAINEEFQPESRLLRNDDSLALLSPVAGG